MSKEEWVRDEKKAVTWTKEQICISAGIHLYMNSILNTPFYEYRHVHTKMNSWKGESPMYVVGV